MSLLIVGGTGTLGRQIVREALDQDFKVVCLVRNIRRASFLKEWGASLVYGDLSLPSTLPNAFKGITGVIDASTTRPDDIQSMKELDWLKDSDLKNYFSDGTKLKGLSDSRVPGLEVTSGSLGHGLSVGVGIAFGNQINKTHQKTFIIVGDGELNEGSCWEAIQFAGHHALSNICMIVDKNNFQAMGETSKIINQNNLAAQIEAFNFNVIEIDGHNEDSIDNAINNSFSLQNNKPSCIVANTIKGKGSSVMENKKNWHYRNSMNNDEIEKTRKELA